jgi:hypothetical protein
MSHLQTLARNRSPSRPRWRALFAHGLLALVLILSQREATLHWLSHATSAAASASSLTEGQKNPPVDSHSACDECGAIASLAAAVHSSAVVLPLSSAAHQLQPAPAWASAAPLLLLAYSSRAPPTTH